MKAMAKSSVLLVALIALIGWLLSLGFTTDAERQALVVSALLATAVQLAAFGVIRITGKQNALVGWGMGAILRGTVLILYGLVFARLLQLPLAAALVSFAVYLFASMLLESMMLAYES